MTNVKTETSNAPLSFVQVLEEKTINMNNPKEIKEFMDKLTFAELSVFFPLVNNKLLSQGIYRLISSGLAKGNKVGSSQYGEAVKAGVAVWERGYLTTAEETRATRVATTGTASRLPFTQDEIVARMEQLAPSGKSDIAKRVASTLTALKTFSVEAFTAYYIKSLDNPKSLMIVATKELSEEKQQAAQATIDSLLNGVELI